MILNQDQQVAARAIAAKITDRLLADPEYAAFRDELFASRGISFDVPEDSLEETIAYQSEQNLAMTLLAMAMDFTGQD